MKKTTYQCSTCGVVTDDKSHLCKPQAIAGREDYCGQPSSTEEAACAPINESLDYECASCGQRTEKPELVCHPTRTKE